MDDFEIELLDADEGENSAAQLPTNFITVGEVSPDDVKVYIKQDVYKALEKYARADVEHERGTIILGRVLRGAGRDKCHDLELYRGKIHRCLCVYAHLHP